MAKPELERIEVVYTENFKIYNLEENTVASIDVVDIYNNQRNKTRKIRDLTKEKGEKVKKMGPIASFSSLMYAVAMTMHPRI